MHGEMKGLNPEVMGNLLEKGKFIIAGDIFGDTKHELRPLHKPCIDKILSMIRVLIIVAGVLGEEKSMAVCDAIVKMLPGDAPEKAKPDDSDLNFDL
ncbi:hypothetical protein ACFLTR_02365 [Chloroflexota bacterium]